MYKDLDTARTNVWMGHKTPYWRVETGIRGSGQSQVHVKSNNVNLVHYNFGDTLNALEIEYTSENHTHCIGTSLRLRLGQ